jgi:hypothetical protein
VLNYSVIQLPCLVNGDKFYYFFCKGNSSRFDATNVSVASPVDIIVRVECSMGFKRLMLVAKFQDVNVLSIDISRPHHSYQKRHQICSRGNLLNKTQGLTFLRWNLYGRYP